MSENFNRIKKKYVKIAIIAGIVLGVCCGVALTCVLAIILKRCAVNLMWAVYIPIALALSAGFSAAFYFILRPDDKRLAKKLDRDLNLNQKAQTMVEFRAAEGAMPALQREQADEILGEAAAKRPDLKWLLKFLFIPVIALALFFAGIFVPARKSAAIDPPYDVTLNQQAELKKLIANVQASNLDGTVKTAETEILNRLLLTLQDAKQQSEMRSAVITAVAMTDTLIASSNSYLAVDGVFKTSTLKELSTAAVRGVIFYKRGSRITSFEAVTSQAAQAQETIRSSLETWVNSIFLADYYTGRTATEEGTPVPVETASGKLSEFSRALSGVLGFSDLSGYVPEEGGKSSDGYFAALTAFADKTLDLSFKSDGRTAATYAADVAALGAGYAEESSIALSAQSYACMMDEYIRNSLARIFGISVSEFGSNSHVAPDSVGSEGDDDPNSGNTDPGYSGGGTKYGSDDLVLDVNTAKPEKYGKFLDEYRNKVKEFKTDECSEELSIFIEQYFQMLYHGLEEDKD